MRLGTYSKGSLRAGLGERAFRFHGNQQHLPTHRRNTPPLSRSLLVHESDRTCPPLSLERDSSLNSNRSVSHTNYWPLGQKWGLYHESWQFQSTLLKKGLHQLKTTNMSYSHATYSFSIWSNTPTDWAGQALRKHTKLIREWKITMIQRDSETRRNTRLNNKSWQLHL